LPQPIYNSLINRARISKTTSTLPSRTTSTLISRVPARCLCTFVCVVSTCIHELHFLVFAFNFSLGLTLQCFPSASSVNKLFVYASARQSKALDCPRWVQLNEDKASPQFESKNFLPVGHGSCFDGGDSLDQAFACCVYNSSGQTRSVVIVQLVVLPRPFWWAWQYLWCPLL